MFKPVFDVKSGANSYIKQGLCSRRLFHNVQPNTYQIDGGMVVIVAGPKGVGKTSLLSFLAVQQMLPAVAHRKLTAARQEAAKLRAAGFTKAEIPPDVKHLVFADIPIRTCKDAGYLPRKVYETSLSRMLVPNGNNDAQFYPWGATIIIDELMAKLDARDHNKEEGSMPPEMRAFMEYCRHRDIAIISSSLVATGVNKRFRQMSQHILLIMDRQEQFKGQQLVATTWYCLEFASGELCERFLNGGKDVFKVPYVFTHHGNIHQCVDSYAENKRFTTGMETRAIEFPAFVGGAA